MATGSPRAAAAALLLALLAATAGAAEPERQAPAPPRSDRERLARADEALDRIRGAARRVDQLLADARAGRDVLRATCVTDRQAQAAGILAAAERSAASLREAIAGRKEGADVELSALALARQKAEETRDAAAGCLGGLKHAGEGTRVTRLPKEGQGPPSDQGR